MPLKIVRNDITKMKVDAIVNTANEEPIYSTGTDTAVYKAAGEAELLAARRLIGYMEEGQVAITAGFRLPAKYIIHAVSPYYIDGFFGEEEKLRACYRNSLMLAHEYRCESIAFPLISTGGFGYPKEEGMRVALDEINGFLLNHDMLIYLVVFDNHSTELGTRLYPALERYIDDNYVHDRYKEEYGIKGTFSLADYFDEDDECYDDEFCDTDSCDFYESHENALGERILHMLDSFQEYLFYLIETKGMTNAEVYKRAIITKQTFSKIKLNPDYHPDKATAMRLCVGARLNLDESKDLLARAGYALSPSDKRDIIFSFFIEHEVFDMIEIDIALEEHGLPCFIE